MTDLNNGWVLVGDREPTIDDADKDGDVWIYCAYAKRPEVVMEKYNRVYMLRKTAIWNSSWNKPDVPDHLMNKYILERQKENNIETLSDEQLERGKGSNLIVQGDE